MPRIARCIPCSLPLAVLAALALCSAQAAAQDETGEAKLQTQRWMEWYRRRAAEAYDIRLGGETDEELTFQSEPLLEWSNPVTTGQIHGAVYVWTLEGRPMVVGQFFSYLGSSPSERVVCHTFQTLADRPVVATLDGEVFWSPEEPGMTLSPIPGAPVPARSRPARLVQMRALARQFVVKTEETNGEREQRLMPQPLYRYPESDDDAADGAVFAFVTGTDPEALLTIQTCATSAGDVWCYGPTRSTLWEVFALHDGNEVWRLPKIEQGRGAEVRRQLYLSTHGILVRPSEIDDEEAQTLSVEDLSGE